jgi:tripartite-type tricarboxylate transporter receptor subunit TctC
MAESGLKDFSSAAWWGLFAPKLTIPENIAKIADALQKTLEDSDVKKRFALQEVEPYPLTGTELAALVQREEAQWSRIVQELQMVQKP